MNPFEWKREHQIALAIATAIGAVIGLLADYLAYTTAQGAGGALNFNRWLNYNAGLGDLLWIIVGAIIGGANVYVRQLLRK